MTITKSELGQTRVYFDEENNRKYGRIVVGLSWPREKGFACVVAAGLNKEIGANQKTFYVLAEIEANILDDLLMRCLDLQELYKVENFYAHKDESYKRLLTQWNRNRGSQPTLHTSSTPHSITDSIEYHIILIKEKLYTNKHLHFFEGSKLPGCLVGVQSGEVKSATEDKFPEVAALGYAVAALASWSGGEIQQNSYVTDYDFYAV